MMTLMPARCMRSTMRSIHAYSNRPSSGSQSPTRFAKADHIDARLLHELDILLQPLVRHILAVISGTIKHSVHPVGSKGVRRLGREREGNQQQSCKTEVAKNYCHVRACDTRRTYFPTSSPAPASWFCSRRAIRINVGKTSPKRSSPPGPPKLK